MQVIKILPSISLPENHGIDLNSIMNIYKYAQNQTLIFKTHHRSYGKTVYKMIVDCHGFYYRKHVVITKSVNQKESQEIADVKKTLSELKEDYIKNVYPKSRILKRSTSKHIKSFKYEKPKSLNLHTSNL